MAKDTKVLLPETQTIVEEGLPIVEVKSDFLVGPTVKVISPSPPQNAPPTEAQQAWMREKPRYVRMSHGLTLTTFLEQGTLRADGSFIPASTMPIHDGNGDFGVGIPTRRR